MSKVGVIGSGIVGQTLAKGFQKHGHEVVIGTRSAGKLADFTKATGIAEVDFATAAGSEILVLAVGGGVAEEAIVQLGVDRIAGKVVIDTTNPIAQKPPVNGVLQFFTGPNESLMEKLQAKAPGAHFVKAFSCVGNAFMVDPNFPGGKPTMFICGNNEEAKATTTKILDQFGWEVADMGLVESARAIEPLCQLWCIPGMRSNQWGHAFKLLKL
jgi:predicted dinucleotide-binding enzyme